MKIIFIKPNMIAGVPGDSLEPLVFAVLLSLSPPDTEFSFYDERIESIPFTEDADLVAVTVDTYTAKRAYQIAQKFRQQNIPVVFGGFHPTLEPEEASQYADSILIGDAEDTWPQVIEDLRAGNLKPFYKSSATSFGEQPPGRHIFHGKTYAPVRFVEYQRGCRFACDFCAIRAMYQGQIKRQKVATVLRDIDANSDKHIVFTDDNLFFDKNSLSTLLEELKRLQIRWSCQISPDIARHSDLVNSMAKAGCISVTMGFESIDKNNLKQMNKGWATDNYNDTIKMLHDHGIMVYGTFVLGYDHDTRDVFENTLDFVLKNRLFVANMNLLMPLPGTTLYARLQAEGRLLMERWWLNDDFRWGHCVFQPAQMTPDELTEGCFKVRQQVNGVRSIITRFPGLGFRQTSFYKTGLYIMANYINRKEIYRKHGKPLGEREICYDE